MDVGIIGAVIGVSVVVGIGITAYIYDHCFHKSIVETNNPLLVKRKSFKVKNLFNHVQI